jgi:hypothetical protein
MNWAQSKPFMKGALPLPRPSVATRTNSAMGDKNKANVTKGPSIENKIAALAAYRMAKGLCRKCGEKWHKGNQCADSVHLNVLQEMWDLIDDNSEESSGNERPPQNNFSWLCLKQLCLGRTLQKL